MGGGLLLFCIGFGCADDGDPGDNGSVDAAVVAVDAAAPSPDTTVEEPDASSGIDWSALHGSQPASPKSLVEFAALNYDETSRSKANLLGKPTVLCFFPFANTPG